MKGFALVLLCVVAAVQGRSTAVQSSGGRTLAALGENSWLVHLRIAIGTSGFLDTCSGTLIDNRWVLTAGVCVQDSRFVWIRYGVVTVINPELVTETSTVRLHPDFSPVTDENNLALVSINRYVQNTANISPVSLAPALTYPGVVNFCGFGENESGDAGDRLSCFRVELDLTPVTMWAVNEDGQEASRHDLGGPLVQDGNLYGILTRPGGQSTEDGSTRAGVFLITAQYASWIEGEIWP